MSLDLTVDAVQLTEDLVNIESVSGNEQEIADAVEAALRELDHLEVQRFGHTVVARTHLGRAERVVIAGHIDTVPLNANLPARRDEQALHGLGTCDMKGGVAIALRLAATMPVTNRDVTYLFYECEEVEAERNGLQLLAQSHPDLLQADFAILMEPSDGGRRGRLPGHAAGRRTHHGRAGALGPLLDRRQRDPRRRGGAGPAQRLRAAPAGHRRAGVPRGPQRGLHLRRRGRQRAARRVRGLGQLPVRAGPVGRRGLRPHARGLRRLRDRAQRLGAGGDARAVGARGRGVRRGGRRHGQPQVRLDRRRAVQRPRHPGGELRPGRPAPGPQAGRVRAARRRSPPSSSSCAAGWEASA